MRNKLHNVIPGFENYLVNVISSDYNKVKDFKNQLYNFDSSLATVMVLITCVLNFQICSSCKKWLSKF